MHCRGYFHQTRSPFCLRNQNALWKPAAEHAGRISGAALALGHCASACVELRMKRGPKGAPPSTLVGRTKANAGRQLWAEPCNPPEPGCTLGAPMKGNPNFNFPKKSNSPGGGNGVPEIGGVCKCMAAMNYVPPPRAIHSFRTGT